MGGGESNQVSSLTVREPEKCLSDGGGGWDGVFVFSFVCSCGGRGLWRIEDAGIAFCLKAFF